MALDVVYCLCGQTTNNNVFMIQCDFCKVWFHGRCVGVREYQAVDIDRFHCPRCEPIHGPSVLKPRLNWHRHDYSEVDATNRLVQTGTQVFIKELKSRHFPGCEDIVIKLRGPQLTLPYIVNNGFNEPILVEEKGGLDLIVPHSGFTVLDVENFVGSEHEVDVIDVQRQTNVKMQLHEFVEYFLSPARTTVLNLISLEFSKTSLSQYIEPPYIVRKLCWVTTSWPSDPPPPPPLNRPNVSKYCLISVENSYTDFHIDFGGTSVWYHVLWGEKIFYLIRPTPANLALYQRWMKANNQSEMFFGDQVDGCYKCTVRAGETFLIPTGWIHAVLTPIDTVVFGGNFLHSHSIELQLQIYEMEKHILTPEKYRFPHYETVAWYAASRLITELRDMASSGTKVPSNLISGARALMGALRHWAGETGKGGLEPPPPGIQPLKQLKELQKEIRTAERQVIALNPPKPERESKRRKKKLVSDDFVDYTELTSFDSAVEERIPVKMKMEDNGMEVKGLLPHGYEIKSDRYFEEEDSPHHKMQPTKITLPKPASYPYSLGIGMSGTPPHDPSYPAFKNDYPSNVKSEFEWSDSPGLASYKLIDPRNLRIRVGRQSIDEASLTGTPTGFEGSPMPIRLRIGMNADGKPGVDSVYEFNNENESGDEREDPGLMIDESPRRKGHRNNSLQPHPLKIRLNLSGGEVIYGEAIDMGGNLSMQHMNQALPHGHSQSHNGIEELLRASAYAPDFIEGSPARIDELESGRASPSTREAIAGMLSMSRVVPSGRTPSRKLGTSIARAKRRYLEDADINKVHQDEDYVYPSLDVSDEEEYQVFKPRGKKKEDEAWNPKARVRVNGPRPERPTRHGVRRQAVERGLEVAAQRRTNLPFPKRAYHRKKQRIAEPQASTSSSPGILSIRPQSAKNLINNRPKKGMATAKQRLGKILKIHKMLH